MHANGVRLETALARVHLIAPDEDPDRFVRQANREGMIFSAWPRAAARRRCEEWRNAERIKSPQGFDQFFRDCDARSVPGSETDWEEHKAALAESALTRLPIM